MKNLSLSTIQLFIGNVRGRGLHRTVVSLTRGMLEATSLGSYGLSVVVFILLSMDKRGRAPFAHMSFRGIR